MVFQRRTDTEKHVVGGMDETMKRYYDEVQECTVVKLFTGGCYVTSIKGEMIVTILGSCIAACIRDPIAGVGGMNHFLLPGDSSGVDSQSMRFGSFSMEQLINELMKRGAQKQRMEVKIFGGGNVMPGLSDVGARNISFVKKFLRDEEIRIVAEDVGTPYPRRVHYFPETGKVMLRKLRRADDLTIAQEEQQYLKKLAAKRESNVVELFQ